MSSSITIPKRKNPQSSPVQAPSSSSSSDTPPFSRTPQTMSSPSTPIDAKSSRPMYDRRPSLLNIFLPSYADRDSSELERRKDPVHDIILTDEEADSVFPS